ncbi:LacI family transcriptional regulator [Martelella endophytica]|uniref:LacI family transcriptional regulator n=1 Tax=Martelella endophytica TaxID=1486262 RepID=A0A0D5LR76_MAREN|nr:LacI family transcriptional regulator [Martelella endophytica]AJY46420.1 LacI family transcriptional regulator [Martelella endophytica]
MKTTTGRKRETASERPTLKTIAYMTGLGVTTVSRALKDAPDIAEHTKERVRLVAKQLGYMPNRAGVRLRTGKTNVIALVLNLEEEIMGMSGQMIFGISDVLADTPYHLVLMPQPIHHDQMAPIRYILDTGSADGVIISRIAPDDARIALMLDRNLPFAAHGRTEDCSNYPFHDFDNDAYAFDAVEKLAARGRKRVVALQPPGHLTYYRHFRTGFERGLARFGLQETPLTSISTDSPLADIRNGFVAALTSAAPPDGIIACSGSSAIPIMAALKSCGLRLGKDIDLVAKQPADFLNWVSPEIIAMSEDFSQAGRELARAVLARIEDPTSRPLHSISKPDWSKVPKLTPTD